MTPDELAQEMKASPVRVSQPLVNQHGQTQVTVEYTWKRDVAPTGTKVAKDVFSSGGGIFDNPTKEQRYVFHFIDDRLARWGKETSAAAKPMEEPAKDPKKDPTTDPTTDPAKDPTKDPKKDPAKNPGKDPGGSP